MYSLINPKFDFVKKISDIEFTFNCGKSRLLLLVANSIAWFNPVVRTKKAASKAVFLVGVAGIEPATPTMST